MNQYFYYIPLCFGAESSMTFYKIIASNIIKEDSVIFSNFRTDFGMKDEEEL